MKVRAWLVASALVVACGARTGLDFDEIGSVGSGSGDAGAGADGATAPGTVGCQDGHFTLHRASPTVMFVLDRSQSMREALENGQEKWTILTSALTTALPPTDNVLASGALIFPVANAGQESCVAPTTADLTPALGNANAIINLLQTTQPHGSTPTADAIDNAAAALTGLRTATSARAMVLATDGEPTCNSTLNAATCRCAEGRCGNDPTRCLDDTRTSDRLATHRDEGIPTYIIGIQDVDDTELVDVLDEMALAGGRPKDGDHRYYAASSEAELTLAFQTIRDQVAVCTYLTSSVPGAQGAIVLEVDGQPVAEGADWTFVNRANGEILLGTTTCGAAAADASSVTVDVRCEAGPPVVVDASTPPLDAGQDADADD